MKKLLTAIFLLCTTVCLYASPKFGTEEYTRDEIDIFLSSINYAFVTSNDVLTGITGAELETLTDGSDADLLHTHLIYVLTDGTRDLVTTSGWDITNNSVEVISNEDGVNIISNAQTGGMYYAGDINIGVKSAYGVYGSGDLNLFTESGDVAGTGGKITISALGNVAFGLPGEEIHIYSEGSTYYTGGSLFLQEDSGAVVIGDTTDHLETKLYTLGDDGVYAIPSPSVIKLIAGTAHGGIPQDGADGGHSIIQSTHGGTPQDAGNTYAGGNAGNIVITPGLGGTGVNGGPNGADGIIDLDGATECVSSLSVGTSLSVTTTSALIGDVTIGSDLVLSSGSITSASGAISFGDEDLSTTGGMSSETLTASGNLLLSTTTASDIGVVMKGVNTFMHDFHHPTGGGFLPLGENVFIGIDSGNFTMGAMASAGTYQASKNVGVGKETLHNLTTGFRNVAIGELAGRDVSSGHSNFFAGALAGYHVNTGFQNFAMGRSALGTLTSGDYNIGIGGSIFSNLNSSGNIGIGFNCGDTITSGNYNIVIGYAKDVPSATASNQLNIGDILTGSMTAGSMTLATPGTLNIAGLTTMTGGSFIGDSTNHTSISATGNMSFAGTAMKTGTTQAAAGAAAGELWADSDDAYTIKLGV